MTRDPDTLSLPLARLAQSRYALLGTFRATPGLDRRRVDTPIWFVIDGSTLWFRTKTDSKKVMRIHDDPVVEIRTCDWRGRHASSEALTGQVIASSPERAEKGLRMLEARYGWQWNVVPMIPIPGVKNGHQDLGVAERLRRMRTRGLWDDSSVIEISLR